mgnify:FL=1
MNSDDKNLSQTKGDKNYERKNKKGNLKNSVKGLTKQQQILMKENKHIESLLSNFISKESGPMTNNHEATENIQADKLVANFSKMEKNMLLKRNSVFIPAHLQNKLSSLDKETNKEK